MTFVNDITISSKPSLIKCTVIAVFENYATNVPCLASSQA